MTPAKTFHVNGITLSADFADNRVPGCISFYEITEPAKETTESFPDPENNKLTVTRPVTVPARIRLVAQYPLATTHWYDTAHVVPQTKVKAKAK